MLPQHPALFFLGGSGFDGVGATGADAGIAGLMAGATAGVGKPDGKGAADSFQ